MRTLFSTSIQFMTAAIVVTMGCAEDKIDSNEIHQSFRAALIITTDYQTGSYSVVDLDTRKTFNNIELIHQDAVCRYDSITNLPYIIARLGSDAIDIVQPEENWHITREYSVGAGTNPQDIAVFSPERAYVALYAEPSLLVVQPSNGDIIGSVDLSAYADEDGIPETAWLYSLNGKVYALLQRLDREAGFLPTDHSLIVVIDGATGVVEASVILAETNPFGKLRYNATLKRFVIIESGVFTTMVEGIPIDGGIEYFDPENNTLSGIVITAEELGGDIVDAVVVSETKGYAIIGVRKGTSAETHLVSFDPSVGEKCDTLLTSDSWVFNFIELTPDGSELWIADRTMTSPGIRILDTATDQELLQGPLDVGLPPFTICFVDTQAGGQNGDADADADSDTDTDSDSDPSESIAYADTVVDTPCAKAESAFGDPALAVNGVRGGGLGAGSLDVFSLRYFQSIEEKYLTVRWSDRTVLNGPGVDFSIFENGFFIGSGPGAFMEHLIVYLSRDGSNWVPFPHDYIHSPETEYSSYPEMWVGFAGAYPVLLHEEDNPVNPFDPVLAGGDHFDLDDLSDIGEAAVIKTKGFTFIKLVQATSEINPDTGNNFLKDPSSFDEAADIDGVYARYLVSIPEVGF